MFCTVTNFTTQSFHKNARRPASHISTHNNTRHASRQSVETGRDLQTASSELQLVCCLLVPNFQRLNKLADFYERWYDRICHCFRSICPMLWGLE